MEMTDEDAAEDCIATILSAAVAMDAAMAMAETVVEAGIGAADTDERLVLRSSSNRPHDKSPYYRSFRPIVICREADSQRSLLRTCPALASLLTPSPVYNTGLLLPPDGIR